MRKLIALAAGVISLALTPAASAGVVIKASPSLVQPHENVLLDTDAAPGDKTLSGTTNQTDTSVLFESSTDNVVSGPQGRAEITATGAGSNDGLGQLALSLADGGTFTSAEFNVLAKVGGSITLDALNAVNEIIAILTTTISKSGQNYFGFLADNSTPISSISIMALRNTNISLIGQFRLDGIVDSPTRSAVPEPATWLMMLLGFGPVGSALRRRKDQAKVGLRVRYS